MGTNSELHPKTSSALMFVCTSMDSTITTSSQDCCKEEAITTLELVSCIFLSTTTQLLCMQVKCYVDAWPTIKWGKKDISTVCVIASSRSQVNECHNSFCSIICGLGTNNEKTFEI